MASDKHEIRLLIDEILDRSDRGGNINKLMNELVEAVNEQPLLFWDSEKIKGLSKVALRVLLIDSIEDEEVEIDWVLKTYAFITKALVESRREEEDNSSHFDILKNRVILLHSHDDFFIETLDYFFFHNTPIETDTDRSDRRAFVLRRIAGMQMQDLRTLEGYDKDLQSDEYLIEVEQKLTDKYSFTEEELIESQLLSDTLYKYIWFKNKKE